MDWRSDAFDLFLGIGIEGAEERAGLLEDIRRIPSYACTSARVGDCHATGDAVWVRFWKDNSHPFALPDLRLPSFDDSGVRPYGVSLLVAGWDINRGPTLYQVDPSGSFWAWKASAIGKNMINAKTFLEKRYNDDISLEDAIHTALLTLKEGFEGQMTEKTIELGVITVPTPEELERHAAAGENAATMRPKPTFRKLTEEEVRDYLAM